MESAQELCFSAIARSVMISAARPMPVYSVPGCFSAIARSVMISAKLLPVIPNKAVVSVL